MPSTKLVDDPKHWRYRADEIRALADDIVDPTAKDILLRISQDYEKLARRAEERAKWTM